MELGARLTSVAGDCCLGAFSAHHGWAVDLGIILAYDFALVGNSRVGGLDIPACVQFNQREVGAFSRTPVHRPNARTILNARTPAERPYNSEQPYE